MKGLGVIFDMDGVLVDSYQAHFESWNDMAGRHGLEMSEEQFAATFGQTTGEIVRKFWSEHVSEADIPAWDDEKEEAYRKALQADFREIPGAGELLGSLADTGFVLAIGSSGPPENVAVALEGLGRADLFAATVSRSDVVQGKPQPEVFLRAAERMNLEPTHCAVVEDAPAGIEAARRAGMVAIALTGTVSHDQLSERAHVVVDSLRELSPKIIADLIQRNQSTP